MRQAQFVIPAEACIDSKTITASASATAVVLGAAARLVKVVSVAGAVLVNVKTTCVDEDGGWQVSVADGGSESFTIDEGHALSVIGDGDVRISSFA